MTVERERHRVRGGRVARMLGVGALAAACTLPAGGAPAAAQTLTPSVPAADEVDALPIHISLTSLEPVAPTPQDTLRVVGSIANTGRTTLQSVRVRLRASNRAVASRSELADSALRTAVFGVAVDDPRAALDLSDLPPGGRASFTLTAAVSALQLSRLGVYPFGVEVRGDDGDGMATRGRLRSWLPFTTPADSAKPTRIAWVWPLVDRPERNTDGSFPDDRLASQLTDRGRLGGLLRAAAAARTPNARVSRAGHSARPVHVTYAVDPALLEALAAMADGYTVRRGNARPTPGKGSAAAAAYLGRLRQLTATDPVLALPYADPDVVALVRAGRAADVSLATGAPAFSQLVESTLATTPLDHVAWPPDGLITRPTLDALTGIDTVVLSGAALPPLRSLTYTPDAATELPAVAGGTLRALVSDEGLDALVAADPVQPGAVRLAEQRFLAETLLITAEQPSISRAVVVTPPRRWAASPAWAGALLAATGRAPWLRPIRLPEIGPEPAGPALRGPLTYPPAAQKAELPRGDFRGPHSVASLAASLHTFRSILTDPEAAGIPAFERGLLRSESAAWRADPAQGRRVRSEVAHALAAFVGKVRITSGGEVSLASKTSSIPVSIGNGLAQPVRIRLSVQSAAASLGTADRGVKRIDAGHQKQLAIRLQASSAGVFPVVVRLLAPDGTPYGAPVKLRVHSTRYGTLAVAITGGAFGVLLLVSGVRLTRRIRGRQLGPAG